MPEIELPLPEEGRDWTETKLFRHIYSVTTIWIVEIGLIKLIGPELHEPDTDELQNFK
jgi:hypothetical protein